MVRTLCMSYMAMVLAAGLRAVCATDRLVEFSSRTLPRLDQLQAALVPTVLGDAAFAPHWAMNGTDHTLRPESDQTLCLRALAERPGGGVALHPCEGEGAAARLQQWRWSATTRQLSLGKTQLCVSAMPIGIMHTLSLVACSAPDTGARWSFSGASSALLVDGTDQALFADSVHPGVRDVLERLAPLLRSDNADDEGNQVLMGCYGWMIDLAVAFTGEPSQSLPTVNPESPQWSTGNATYHDLRLLTRELKTAALARGLHRLKLGALFVGWAKIYNLQSNFSLRHPELYINGGSQLSHAKAWHMNADQYPYASMPRGAFAGMSFFELFGKQWKAFSTFAGLEAIILRDGLSGWATHGRSGPCGETACANVSVNNLYINGVRELFKQTKTNAPNTTVIGYSQEQSAVGIWRVGLSDVEALVGDGFIDAYVDQSWAGAWEDVPTRASKTTGWTHHLAYILVHRAQIEGGNRRRRAAGINSRCRHYVLHGTFDAYEGFDTIHQVPGKLQWGIWAYSHAALVEAGGSLRFLDGHYVSWANSYSYVTRSTGQVLDNDNYLDRPTGLLTRTDVAWLASVMDSTDVSIRATTQIAGPTVIYDRASLQALMLDPQQNANEWVDEQLGVLLKYGMPVLKIARIEDGVDPRQMQPDGAIFSIPAVASDELVDNVTALANGGSPVVLLGRCDHVASPLLVLAGANCSAADMFPPFYGLASINLPDGTVEHANISLGVHGRTATTTPEEALAVLDSSGGSDVIISAKGNTLYAQLNDYLPAYQGRKSNLAVANYGMATPHYLVATRSQSRSLRVASGITQTQPASVHMWREGKDTIVLLAGNLDSNNCAGLPCSVPTALTPRNLALEIQLGPTPRYRAWSLRSRTDGEKPQVIYASVGGVLKVSVKLALAGSRVYELSGLESRMGGENEEL